MPVKVPKTRYARNGDLHIAYQVIGDGPMDLVVVPGWVSNVEWFWESPFWAEVFDRFSSFARVILWDKRGRDSPTRSRASRPWTSVSTTWRR